MQIRKATIDDLPEIMAIYNAAQDFMIESGNPHQWGRSYPGRDLVEDDISNGVCHLICSDDGVHGAFALFDGREETYQYIENGEWLNDDEYLTIHRIAGDGKVHGIFDCAVSYCKKISDNIRIDTHADNTIMQKLIERNGFQKCGTIYVRDGTPRMAYQWVRY